MRYARLPLVLALICLLLVACSDDDPVSPEVTLWTEVALDLTGGESRMAAVDFTGSHGLAMGLAADAFVGFTGFDHVFYGHQPDGTWIRMRLADIRDGMVGFDLAVDTDGKAVICGFQVPGPPSILLDLRGSEPEYIEQGSYGMLTVDGQGSFMAAGGRASGEGLWTSNTPGDWTVDNLPLVGGNDTGFRDVYIRGNQAVACGYDDAADTLQVLLTRTSGTGWTHIKPVPAASRTYWSVALGADGTIYLGGIDGAGGMSPQAFLMIRTPGGEWTDYNLPDPGDLEGVTDILIAQDGSLYLTCEWDRETSLANLVHVTPAGAKREITAFHGGLLQVDQAADGTIYAVGYRQDPQTGDETGVMLTRSP